MGTHQHNCVNPKELIDKIQVGERWNHYLPSPFHTRYKLRLFQTAMTPNACDDGTATIADLSILTRGTGVTSGTKDPGDTGSKDSKISKQEENRRFNKNLFRIF